MDDVKQVFLTVELSPHLLAVLYLILENTKSIFAWKNLASWLFSEAREGGARVSLKCIHSVPLEFSTGAFLYQFRTSKEKKSIQNKSEMQLNSLCSTILLTYAQKSVIFYSCPDLFLVAFLTRLSTLYLFNRGRWGNNPIKLCSLRHRRDQQLWEELKL